MGVPLKPSPYLRHVESGTVSISATGQEVAFGLARSLTLDATHLVKPGCGSLSLMCVRSLCPRRKQPRHSRQQQRRCPLDPAITAVAESWPPHL